MNNKKIVKKCSCGYEIMPFMSNMITDAWVDKKFIAHFEFRCPDCNKKNEYVILWDK
jgi:acetone carboxylase gamma subunit